MRNPLTPVGWAIAGGVVLLFAVLVYIIFIGPARDRRAALNAKVGSVVAEGETNAMRDAMGVIIDNSKRETDRVQLDQKNEAAIRSGDPGAGMRALCLRDAYRDSPACRKLP